MAKGDSFEQPQNSAEPFDAEEKFPHFTQFLKSLGIVSFGKAELCPEPYASHVTERAVLLNGEEIGKFMFSTRSLVYVGQVPEATVRTQLEKMRSRVKKFAPPTLTVRGGTSWVPVRLNFEPRQRRWARGDGWGEVPFP